MILFENSFMFMQYYEQGTFQINSVNTFQTLKFSWRGTDEYDDASQSTRALPPMLRNVSQPISERKNVSMSVDEH